MMTWEKEGQRLEWVPRDTPKVHARHDCNRLHPEQKVGAVEAVTYPD